MRGLAQKVAFGLGLAAAIWALAGCSTGTYYAEAPLDLPGEQVDAADVTCAPLGNRGGFQVEFPPCHCNHGIALSWIGRHPSNRDGWTGFVLRRGYLSDVVPEVLVASSDGKQIERVLVRDEESYLWVELEPDRDGFEWRRNQALFTEIMQEFGPRLHEFDMYCRAREEAGRQRRQKPAQQASLALPSG